MAQDEAGQGNKTRRNTKKQATKQKSEAKQNSARAKDEESRKNIHTRRHKSNYTSHVTEGMPNPDETRQRTQLKKAASVTRASLKQTSEDQQEEPTQDSSTSHQTKIWRGKQSRKKTTIEEKLRFYKNKPRQDAKQTRRKVRKQNDGSRAHL